MNQSINLKITFETRREMGVLMCDEDNLHELYEVIGRARQYDPYGAEIETLVLVRRVRDEFIDLGAAEITTASYFYNTGIEVETKAGRKYRSHVTPKQSGSCFYDLPVAMGEFLLHAAVTGRVKEVFLREDFSLQHAKMEAGA